jgi:hypothetical protein
MSSRFHNKWHRHNHHTKNSNDPRYPDSAHDPIASPAAPFQGDFVVQATVSATQGFFSKTVQTDVDFPDDAAAATSSSMQTTNEFLRVFVDGEPRYIRLWLQQSLLT